MPSRISKGFGRLAAFCSVPVAAFSGFVASVEVYRSVFSSPPNPFDQFDKPATGAPYVLPSDMPTAQHADFTDALVLLGLAVLVYGMIRMLGWVVDGFTRSPQG